jgi:hypothetical protein
VVTSNTLTHFYLFYLFFVELNLIRLRPSCSLNKYAKSGINRKNDYEKKEVCKKNPPKALKLSGNFIDFEG